MVPAGVAKLADARDLKSLDPDTGRAGSTPAPGTPAVAAGRQRSAAFGRPPLVRCCWSLSPWSLPSSCSLWESDNQESPEAHPVAASEVTSQAAATVPHQAYSGTYRRATAGAFFSAHHPAPAQAHIFGWTATVDSIMRKLAICEEALDAARWMSEVPGPALRSSFSLPVSSLVRKPASSRASRSYAARPGMPAGTRAYRRASGELRGSLTPRPEPTAVRVPSPVEEGFLDTT